MREAIKKLFEAGIESWGECSPSDIKKIRQAWLADKSAAGDVACLLAEKPEFVELLGAALLHVEHAELGAWVARQAERFMRNDAEYLFRELCWERDEGEEAA